MKLSSLKIDAAKIEAGEWIEDIPGMGDLALKVRGLDNADHGNLRSRLFEAIPRSKKHNGRITDPAEADRLTARCLSEAVLLDWRGLEEEDGSPIPFSKERAFEILSNPDMRSLREAVVEAAARVGRDDAESLKADAGNLRATSVGG